ncbi:MAG: hypothetical protein ACLVAW_15765 [Eisenbergiella massiliensis]
MERAGNTTCFSSFCTGWAPNQCRYACADSMEGRWSTLTDIGDSTTYHTQPAFILPWKRRGRRFIITWRTDGTVKITTIPVM